MSVYTHKPTASMALLPLETTPERFRQFLYTNDIGVRYDVRGMRQQVMMPGEKEWEDVTDGIASRVRSILATTPTPLQNRMGAIPDVGGVLVMRPTMFAEMMDNACAHNMVDPLLEYIEDEIPRWDRMPRLGAWLHHCFEVAPESDDLAEWASVFVFLGAVARAKQPGVKLDEMPVLIGKGGIGKSTALRYTLPPHLRYMFTDGLNLASQPKERVEALQGRAIVEAAEMQGARRADLESLKAFLSRTDDGSTRLAYRHNPEPMPRRCILVGTADRPDPLPDDPNLRRFVPITLEGGDVGQTIEYMDACRGQLWAEALAMYESGESARLPDHLKHQQVEAADSARAGDSVLEDAIDQYLIGAPELLTTEMVALGIGIARDGETAKLSRTEVLRITSVLRHKGYTTVVVTRQGEKLRRWKKTALATQGHVVG